MTGIHLNDSVEQKFLEDICREYGVEGPNKEAHALFSAIQAAFTAGYQSKGCPLTDLDLVTHLAACAWVGFDYDKAEHIPLESSDHDFIFQKTLRGFIRTVAKSIQENNSWIWQDAYRELFFGCFKIPSWFVNHVLSFGGSYC